MAIDQLNKAFESRVRLGLLSILIVGQWVEFKTLKSQLKLTDGNLASHLNTLERINYLEVKKAFVGKKTQTTYRLTKEGRQAFKEHLAALESLIANSKQ